MPPVPATSVRFRAIGLAWLSVFPSQAHMTAPHCAMTGVELQHGDGIWDDGEWLSWDQCGLRRRWSARRDGTHAHDGVGEGSCGQAVRPRLHPRSIPVDSLAISLGSVVPIQQEILPRWSHLDTPHPIAGADEATCFAPSYAVFSSRACAKKVLLGEHDLCCMRLALQCATWVCMNKKRSQ